MAEDFEQLLRAHTEQDRQSFEELKREVLAGRADVAELKATVIRYKGFVGGIVFTVSALGTALGLAIAWLHR